MSTVRGLRPFSPGNSTSELRVKDHAVNNPEFREVYIQYNRSVWCTTITTGMRRCFGLDVGGWVRGLLSKRQRSTGALAPLVDDRGQGRSELTCMASKATT